MILSGMDFDRQLATRQNQRLSVALAAVMLLATLGAATAAVVSGLSSALAWSVSALVAAGTIYVVLNAGFLRYTRRVAGVSAALGALPLLFVFHICCGVSVVLGTTLHLLTGGAPPLGFSPTRANTQSR